MTERDDIDAYMDSGARMLAGCLIALMIALVAGACWTLALLGGAS